MVPSPSCPSPLKPQQSVGAELLLPRAQANRKLHRAERNKLGLPFVSLAGYTSSGKTTLFNKLAAESREESPKLFTTLTTTMRAVSFADAHRKVMLSDTVGFISRLPTYMIESFKSTLEELIHADLVLLMLDCSEERESMSIKLRSCRETLDQLGVDPKKILQRDRCPGRLLQNMRRNIHQRRTTFRDEGRHKLCPGSIGQIKRATMGVEDAGRSFDNQSMQIRRPDCFAESFAKSMQEIENQGLLDLNLFLRTFQPANAPSLPQQSVNPQTETGDQQPEENRWPHEVLASLLRRCRLMKVLL